VKLLLSSNAIPILPNQEIIPQKPSKLTDDPVRKKETNKHK